THLARLLAGLLARAAGLLARGRTRTRRRLARPPPGRAQTCARADEIARAVRGEGRARTCSDEGAAQLRRPGGGCAWRGPPLRSRVELQRHGALSAPPPGGVGPRGTAAGSGERPRRAAAAHVGRRRGAETVRAGRRRPTWDGGERRSFAGAGEAGRRRPTWDGGGERRAFAPGGVGPRGTAAGSGERSPAPGRPGGVGPRGTAAESGERSHRGGVGPRGTAAGSGERSPAPGGREASAHVGRRRAKSVRRPATARARPSAPARP